jgi:dolichol-phosphate mannosyltransferase
MLSLILPTYNEAENLPVILPQLQKALASIPHEIIVVDDNSPDRTWEKAETLKKHYPSLVVIRRVGRRGLSSAVVEGFLAAKGETLAVMDADGQHDSELLPKMIEAIESGSDVVIGSRYLEGGSVGNWNIFRKLLSSSGTIVTRLALRRHVADPLSGFFMMRTSSARPLLTDLHPEGFKILLDLLARLPAQAKVREIPFVFRTRIAGESKLTFSVHLAVLRTLFPLLLKRFGLGLFLLICLLIALVLLPRVWQLRALYSNSSVRVAAQQALQHTADTHGLLLSQFSIRHIEHDRVTVDIRDYKKGTDTTECRRISLHEPFTDTTCDD